MVTRTVFTVFDWSGETPELLTIWSKEERAEKELLKLQSESPEGTFFILPKHLTSVNDS